MQLLNITEIKQQKNKDNIERMIIVDKLYLEEKRLLESVNNLRNKTYLEIDNLNSVILKKQTEYRKIINELRKEVSSLEKRKLKALQPINEIKKEAEKILKNAKEYKIQLDKRNEEIQEIKEELSEKIMTLQDKSEDLDEREIEIVKKENKIVIVSGENKKSQERLATAWVDFHKQINKINLDIKEREQKVIDKEKVNKIIEELLNNREKELDIKDRQIIDKYKSLIRAREEILGKNK